MIQAVHPAALPGLRGAYTKKLNDVIRQELRLYASNLRKAVSAGVVSGPPEPDMGVAHKRVSLAVHLCSQCNNTTYWHIVLADVALYPRCGMAAL